MLSSLIFLFFKALFHFILQCISVPYLESSVCGQAHQGLIVGYLLLWYSVVCTVESFISFVYLDLYVQEHDTSMS